ncbi:MAG: hypothetical protein DWQ37_09230 [Planctomycetota bacterium]|nr:MAG: hypothetical protein DWQ37_09230 [Planctomycetota bacterium]
MNEALPQLLLLSHVAATLCILGVIWFVQVVHYPLFANAESADFQGYAQRHTQRTTWVVALPMLVEGGTALLLFGFSPRGVSVWQLWVGLVLLAAIWISTALLQVPCHKALSRGFDPRVHERLVWTNWIRTTAWSLRALLVLWMAMSSFG